jgi:DUF4097 and DUF4098 domain-containing protein YvlB
MKHDKAMITGAVLGAIAALFLTAGAWAQRTPIREEFHQVYPLNAGGSVEVRNINGFVHITAWDRNEVKVDAVKWAYTPERVKEADIRVNATADRVVIRTHYPEGDLSFRDDDENNPATVDYTLTVPASARLDEIKLINGDLTVENVAGEVHGSSINGTVKASGLRGRTELSTINGPVEANFASIGTDGRIELKSVNGSVSAVLPSDANAEVSAKTVHGAIRNDFGLPVEDGRYVGHRLEGRIGAGQSRVDLKNVNGGIRIRRASDGKQPSPVTNLLRDRMAEMD